MKIPNYALDLIIKDRDTLKKPWMQLTLFKNGLTRVKYTLKDVMTLSYYRNDENMWELSRDLEYEADDLIDYFNELS